jgi:uncharacterized protein YqhQ
MNCSQYVFFVVPFILDCHRWLYKTKHKTQKDVNDLLNYHLVSIYIYTISANLRGEKIFNGFYILS